MTIPPSHYQSFEKGAGSSDSFGKLEALKLPDLKGKRFLDLGCNHGFFCLNALKMGASEVVGVDRDPVAITAATARAASEGVSDRARFINSSWDDFNEGGFDVIILLSALHYAKDQVAMLAKIAGMLKPDGLLILEGGAIENPRHKWTSIIRGKPPHTDIVDYPTPRHMMDILSENFAPRDRGKSVIQPGDLVPRYVWHCQKLKRMILAISAPPFGGKTTLGFALQRQGIPLIDIDEVVVASKNQDSDLGRCISSVFKIGELNKAIENIQKSGLQSELALEVVKRLESDWMMKERPAVTAVMGMSLLDKTFHDEFARLVAQAGYNMWDTTKPS